MTRRLSAARAWRAELCEAALARGTHGGDSLNFNRSIYLLEVIHTHPQMNASFKQETFQLVAGWSDVFDGI